MFVSASPRQGRNPSCSPRVRNVEQPSILGETVNHVDVVSSTGIVFSRKELFEDQQKHQFVIKCSMGSGSWVVGLQRRWRQLVQSAVGAEHSGTAGNAMSTLDSYLLDSNGVPLTYSPTEDDTIEAFKVVIPRVLKGALLRYFHASCFAGHSSGPKTCVKIVSLRCLARYEMGRDSLHPLMSLVPKRKAAR